MDRLTGAASTAARGPRRAVAAIRRIPRNVAAAMLRVSGRAAAAIGRGATAPVRATPYP